MFMKKLSVTFILSFGLIGALLTACFCKDVQPYWKPVSGSATVFSMLDSNLVQLNSGDTLQADSVAFRLSYEAEFLSMQYNPFAQLGNVVRATQKCPVDGHQGLKNKISSISVTSNKEYNGVSSGEDISSSFRYNGLPLESSYIDILNNYGYDYLSFGWEREIYLVTQPTNPVERNITFKLEFENGEILTMQTLNFTW